METSQSFATRSDAELFKRQVEAMGAKGRDHRQLGRHLFLGDVARAWVTERGFAERTLRTTEQHLRNHLLPALGAIPVGAMTPLDVERFMPRIAHLEPATQRRILQILRQCLRFAKHRGLCERDPTEGFRIRGSLRRRPRLLPTIAAVEQLVTRVEPRFQALIDLMAYGGASISEAAALRTCDFDFADCVIHIRRSLDLDPSGRPFVSDKMKTPTRDRRVTVVPDHVWQRLDHLRARDGAQLVTTSNRGHILNVGNFRKRAFAPAVNGVAACPDGLRPHDLRHFACSLWIAAGHSVYDVSQWAGHTDVRLVERIYGHALPRAGDDFEATVLEDVYRQASRPRTHGSRS